MFSNIKTRRIDSTVDNFPKRFIHKHKVYEQCHFNRLTTALSDSIVYQKQR